MTEEIFELLQGRKYVYVAATPRHALNAQQQKAITKLLCDYIVCNWGKPRIRKQYYAVGCDFVGFTCLKTDVPILEAQIRKIFGG